MGRLNNVGGWCSGTNDNIHEFLEVDLRNVQHISRIATQGVPGSSLNSDSYVKTFLVAYSYDGTKWFTYEGSGSVQTFHGNSDTFNVKNNYFRDTFVSRYIRIYPKTFENEMCLRVELYGCNDPSDDCSRYITTASGSIHSLSILGSYPANKDCTWLIEVSNDKIISFMFTLFDVYQGSSLGSCDSDYVEVRDGLTDSSPVIGGKYCNQNRAMLLTTKKNVARIDFHTGIANLGHKGFQLYFLSVTKDLDEVLSGTACEGEVFALDCSGYQNTINILHAWYQVDSFPFSCGQNHDYSSSTSCPAFDAMDEILSKCQGYKKCLISVSESSFPVQSCARVRRRLEVFYRCNSTNNRSKMSSFSLLQSLLSTYIVMEFTCEIKWHHMISVLKTAESQKCYHVTRIFELQTKTNATAPKPQLTTSTTSAPTASPITINTHMWHSLTSHVIELPTKVKATEIHAVTVSNTLPGSTDQNTEVPSNVSDDPTSGWENKDPIADEALIGIISVSVFILLVLILVVLFCRWRKGYV
ncbi:uncharacterized protein LOC122964985 [Acropora millepora]|uniref:uncharacterized protein LOC122964985 n=1 Tax=Acropora millepora TaxID=45264 RepID=UPI001CF4BBB3|nr:uncharacterized protein LOC122964985 [Acropora millepora]